MDMQNIEKCIGLLKYNLKAWCALVTRKRNIKPRFWLMLMVVMLVVFVSIWVSGDGILNRQAAQVAQLESDQEKAAAANAELERKISFAKTDEYVERVAREELGLLKPGEIRYVAGSEGSTQTDGQ